MRRISLLLVAVLAASALAAPLVAAPKGTNHNKSTAHAAECDGDNELVIHAPSTLWPPNHKYYEDLHVAAVDGGDGSVRLTTQGYHDQWDGDVEANGAGNTADDIVMDDEDAMDVTPAESSNPEEEYPTVIAYEEGAGSVQTDWKARAERSGRFKEGRTYTLVADATYSDGSTCSHEWSFTVPHDMRKSNRQG